MGIRDLPRRSQYRRISFFLSSCAAASAFPGTATGETKRPFAYEVPSECPGRTVFEVEVERRSRAGSTAERSREVSVTRAPEGHFVGRLVLEDGERELVAATCPELVAALALATAMARDASGTAASTTELPAESLAATTIETRSSASTATPPVERRPRPALGVAIGGTTAAAPQLVPTLGVFAGIEAVKYALRLSAVAARSGQTDLVTGSADFDRWTGRLALCPFAYHVTPLRIAPCAAGEIGLLVGSGRALPQAQSRPLPWLSALLGARVQWNVGGGLFLEGEGWAEMPLLRHTYILRPQTTVFSVPSIGVGAGLAVGYLFSK